MSSTKKKMGRTLLFQGCSSHSEVVVEGEGTRRSHMWKGGEKKGTTAGNRTRVPRMASVDHTTRTRPSCISSCELSVFIHDCPGAREINKQQKRKEKQRKEKHNPRMPLPPNPMMRAVECATLSVLSAGQGRNPGMWLRWAGEEVGERDSRSPSEDSVMRKPWSVGAVDPSKLFPLPMCFPGGMWSPVQCEVGCVGVGVCVGGGLLLGLWASSRT